MTFNRHSYIYHYKNAFEKVVFTMSSISTRPQWVNTLMPRQNGRHFADDIFKCIFFKENVWIPIKISLKFIPNGPINNIPALVLIMTWRRSCDKPISEPMMVRLPTHICVARPQWVNSSWRMTPYGVKDIGQHWLTHWSLRYAAVMLN